MKTPSFLVSALLLCLPAVAQHHTRWEAVLLNDSGLFHFDPHSVSSAGAVHTFQSMVDYKVAQETAGGKKYLSTVTEIQLNCKNSTARIKHMAYFAGSMGSGKEVHKEGMIRDWLDVPPASPIERIARRIC